MPHYDKPPPDYSIEFNVATKKYGFCMSQDFCPRVRTFDTEVAAIEGAWGQFEYGRTSHEKPYDPNQDEANWFRVRKEAQ